MEEHKNFGSGKTNIEIVKMDASDRATIKSSPFLRQLLPVSGIVLYMIGTGCNIAYPGVLLQQLRQNDTTIRLTKHHESWIASSLGLAIMGGILVSPWCLQILGRKTTNQLSNLPSLAGWTLLMMSSGHQELIASRCLQGFAMGVQASAAPVSIAEYTSPSLRGAFLATIAFSFGTGMLIAHLFGTFLNWRTAALGCGSVYAFSLIVITLSPESPPWLASKGHFERCKKSFRWLRGYDPASEKELMILLNSQKVDPLKETKKTSRIKSLIAMVRKPEFYKPACIMIFMFILFQVSGMTVIPSYTVDIMDEVTNRSIDSQISMLSVDLVRFSTSVLACVVVYRYPRRTVLFVGSTISVLALFLTSILLYLRSSGYLPVEYDWVPMVTTLLYIFGKTLGILPIPWAVAGEVFPLAFRSLGGGISGMILSAMFFVVVKTAPSTLNAINVSGTFCLYGVCILICNVVLYFILPETKGKTLYEIECHFKNTQINKVEEEKDKMLDLNVIESRD